MIPKRYRRKNNRMSWSYVMDREGNVRAHIKKMGFNPSVERPLDMYLLLVHLFPHKVVMDKGLWFGSYDEDRRKEVEDWFTNNLSNAWQLWSEHTQTGVKEVVYFETEADWLHFKLRWEGNG